NRLAQPAASDADGTESLRTAKRRQKRLKSRSGVVTSRSQFPKGTGAFYVATSQSQRSQHHYREAERLETFRARRAFEEARPAQGRAESGRPAEDQTGRVTGIVAGIGDPGAIANISRHRRSRLTSIHLAPEPLPRRIRVRFAATMRVGD